MHNQPPGLKLLLRNCKRGIRCACGRGDACGHVVAPLLHIHQNFVDLAKAAVADDRLPACAIFGGVLTPKLTTFLRSGVKRDARLRFLARFGGSDGMGRPDYRGIADDMFAKVAEGGLSCFQWGIFTIEIESRVA